MKAFPFTLAFFVLCSVAATAPLNASRLRRPADVRLRLTAQQLDNVGCQGRLPLTRQQRQRVFAATGKEVPYVFITYVEPDGELGELGYNLALRDRPDSVLLLGMYALDKTKIAAKETGDQAMIGPMEKATKDSKESASFEIDAQGRICTVLGQSEFVRYLRAHQGSFGFVYIEQEFPSNSAPLACQDTLRFMKCQLRKAGAPFYVYHE